MAPTWWTNLDGRERTLIAVGVPAVAVAALASSLRSKKAAATAPASTTTTVMTGPPTFGTGSTEMFDLYRQFSDQFTDFIENFGSDAGAATPPPVAALPTPNPCTPGTGWDPTKCNDADLVSSCINTNGDQQVLAELWRRGHSINDPNFGGPGSPNACGRAAVLYWLAHGAIPYA